MYIYICVCVCVCVCMCVCVCVCVCGYSDCLFDSLFANNSRELHKIGVIFVNKNQDDQRTLLCNEEGTPEYEGFLSSLGWAV